MDNKIVDLFFILMRNYFNLKNFLLNETII
jgi:hypothetical protein